MHFLIQAVQKDLLLSKEELFKKRGRFNESQEFPGLGRSNMIGGLVGWKLTVHVEELINVV